MIATAPVHVAVETPRFLTVDQFARRFQISRAKVYQFLSSGRVRSVLIDSSRRIPISAAQEFEDGLTGGGISE